MESAEPTLVMRGPGAVNAGAGGGVRLLKQVCAVAAGVGVFVLVASVVDPQLSPAEESIRSAGAVPVLTAQQREQVERMLLSRKHPKGWSSLGLLEGTEYYTLAYSSPDGPLYTVCSLTGQVLLADLPADDVYRAFPTLDLAGMRLDPAHAPMSSDGGPLMLAEPRVQPLD